MWVNPNCSDIIKNKPARSSSCALSKAMEDDPVAFPFGFLAVNV